MNSYENVEEQRSNTEAKKKRAKGKTNSISNNKGVANTAGKPSSASLIKG